MTLTLIRPSHEGQERIRLPKRTRKAHFPPAEQSRIRAALRNLRRAFGSWSCLGAVTGYASETLVGAACQPNRATPTLVYRVARAVGLTVDELLRPGLRDADACPTCGRKGAA
ncbi:transcriptional regulator [Polyangium sp. y55x31]|uniref:transcriptional regulator n=1 Tax=Polyangium sp. y55x31 TaxID=3042688 RepID=UPI002482EF78|nr:transcriptional regulator [Polyangium sp. y55x31]MDI1481460.1 transcriptional regulator [Polyangium sp. y55x31]